MPKIRIRPSSGGGLVRGAAAVAAGLVVSVLLLSASTPPRLHPVAVVTTAVSAGTVLAAADISNLMVAAPPAGALTVEQAEGRYAQTPLYPGDTVSAEQVGPSWGAAAGDVKVVVPVTAAGSALAQPGGYVEVYGMTTAAIGSAPAVTLLAPRAKVLGVYTTSATPITASSPGAPALVALAVTPAEAQAIVPYEGSGATVTLVDIPQ